VFDDTILAWYHLVPGRLLRRFRADSTTRLAENADRSGEVAIMQFDAVCGQQVRKSGKQLVVEYAGERYYFCSLECLDRFDAQPDLFTSQPGEGLVANRDRYLLPGYRAGSPRAGPHAILEPADSDDGPG
jgi:YHS domain-containing protein